MAIPERCGKCGEQDCECEKCPECGDNDCDSDECRAMQMEPHERIAKKLVTQVASDKVLRDSAQAWPFCSKRTRCSTIRWTT